MYSQAAGHSKTMAFQADKIEKVTKESEAKNYHNIFNNDDSSLSKLQPFLPKFYWSKDMGGGKHMICIENLLYGIENGSIIDIKLGTSTLTSGKNCCKRFIRN